MRKSGSLRLVVAAIALGLPAFGCSTGGGQSPVLSEAIYAKKVPVYAGATFTESMGNETWGDEADSYTQGQTWWFKTKASKQEMLAYYQKLYPGAERLELDTGDIQLRWVPQGASPYEDVTIVIGDGELRIGESVSPKTKARARDDAGSS